jgi:hypothetical protein
MRITIQIDDAAAPSTGGAPVSVSTSGLDDAGAAAQAPPLDAGPAPTDPGDDEGRASTPDAAPPGAAGSAESAGAAPSFDE